MCPRLIIPVILFFLYTTSAELEYSTTATLSGKLNIIDSSAGMYICIYMHILHR